MKLKQFDIVQIRRYDQPTGYSFVEEKAGIYGVLISHPDILEHGRIFNFLICNEPDEKRELQLNEVQIWAHSQLPLVCQCHFAGTISRGDISQKVGSLSDADQVKVSEKIIEIFRLQAYA